MKKRDYKTDTLIAHLGRDPKANHGVVNPPVYHASTILHDNLASFERRGRGQEPEGRRSVYGRFGTPTLFALEDAVAALEGGAGSICVSSGLAAITGALLALLEGGDHILVSDTAYRPTRTFCDTALARFGIETSYYDPLIGEGIAALIKPNTKVVYTESPGSLSFDMQDIPAIAGRAKAGGAAVVMDNTWATSLYFPAFEKGVDVTVQAGTKYLVGHSDAMLGMITATAEYEERIRKTVQDLGICSGPDDVYLALRGLRTLSVRLARHQDNALRLARWLQARSEIARVLYPPLPEDPGHALWKRDFTGACGLFGIVLSRPYPKAALAAMIDGFELFGIGASWGGYESLVLTADPATIRTVSPWDAPGPLVRFHAGLEDPDDLIADLAAGLTRLNEAAGAED